MARQRRVARPLTQIANPDTREALPWFCRGAHVDPTSLGLPVQIRVLGQAYRVFVVPGLCADRRGRVRLLGACSYEHRAIAIAAEQPHAKALQTLGHEIGHVYLIDQQRRERALRTLSARQTEAICDMIADVLEDRR